MSAVADLMSEHDEFRMLVRSQLGDIVLPNADQWEAQRYISEGGWHALAEAGLLAHASSGEGFLRSAVLLEEIGRTGYAGVRSAIGIHAYMAVSYIELFGSLALRDRYLPAVRRGERVAALAITESDAGSDLQNLRTWAEPTGDGYRVNGAKLYVANGSRAGFVVTLCRTRRTPSGRGPAGMSLLVVDTDSPGVSCRPQSLLGYHSADVCRLEFSDVVVPADRLIGRADRALMYLIPALDFERLVAGLLAVGGAWHCLDLLNRFAAAHRIKGEPLSSRQVVRHRLADLNSDFELVRHYAYHVAWLHSQGRLDTRAASTVKLKATELAAAAAQACLRYHGARGYLSDSTAARLYRDAVAGTIAAGASELLRDIIFESTLATRS
jgi:alkylation response protein AidB-like acyl-CoA dehydrogenase